MVVVWAALALWLVLVVLVLAALRAAALADRAQERLVRRGTARGRAGAAAVVMAVAVTPGAASPAEAQRVDGVCPGANAAPDAAHPRAAVATTLCLINQKRTRRGLAAVHLNRRLSRAAQRHADDMVARGYFSHVSPGGTTLADRLRRAKYITRRCAWRVGETLAWGYGTAVTPASRVSAWMHSRSHRMVLLDRDYRDVGVGIAEGRPDHGGDGATYGADFGDRRCR